MLKRNYHNLFIRISIVILLLLAFVIVALIIGNQPNEIVLPILIVFFVLNFLFILELIVYYFRKNFLLYENISQIVPEIESETENNYEAGYLLYDENDVIIYISPFLMNEGFKVFLGKKIEYLALNDEMLNFKDNFYQYNEVKRNKQIIFKKSNYINQLKNFIDLKENSLLLINKQFSSRLKKDEIEKVRVDIEITEFFKEFAKRTESIIRTETSDESNIIIFGNGKQIIKHLNEKIFTDLKLRMGKSFQDVILSIGVARNNKSLIELEKNCLKALEISRNRGGNQIIIIDEMGNLSYIGKSSQIKESTTKLELKLFYEEMLAKMKKLNYVFLSTHKNSDIDALASVMAFLRLTKSFKIKAYAVIESYNTNARLLLNDLPLEDKNSIISEEEAMKIVTKNKYNSGIFIFDVSNIEIIQASKLLMSLPFDQRFLIDHHRIQKKIQEFPSLNSYIDISASSTSEIIAEILSFSENIQIDTFNEKILNGLIAGIYTDTNNLTKNMSKRTYDSLSYLINSGGELSNIFKYTKRDIGATEDLSYALKNYRVINDKFILIVFPENKIVEDLNISYISDSFLSYEKIEGAFVLGKINSNNFKLSIRTNLQVNAQVIAEKLGGGGHFNTAAVTWNIKNNKYKNIEKIILEELNNIK